MSPGLLQSDLCVKIIPRVFIGPLMCVTFEPTKVFLVQSQKKKNHTECTLIFENTYSAGVVMLTCPLFSQSGSLLIVVRLLKGNQMEVVGYTCNNLSTDV